MHDQPAPDTAARSRRRWPAVLALGTAAAALTLSLLLATTPGLRMIAVVTAALSGGALEAEVSGGSLLDAPQFARITLRVDQDRYTLEKLQVTWSPRALTQGRLQLQKISAARLLIQAAATTSPPQPPQSLAPPLDIEIETIECAQLQIDAQPQADLKDVRGSLRSTPGRWQATLMALAPFGPVRVEAGVDQASPFATVAEMQAHGEFDGREWRADATVGGHLAGRLEVVVKARGMGLSGRAEAALEAFAPMPLRAARLQLGRFDPAALAAQLPHASITAQLQLAPQSQADQIGGRLELRNAEPGRLDAGLVPLAELRGNLTLGAGLARLSEARIAFAPGGSAVGSVELVAGRINAELELAGVDAAAWDRRLLPTRLAGSLKLEGGAASQQLRLDLREPRFQVQAYAQRQGDHLALEQLLLAAGPGRLELAGSVALAAPYDMALQGRVKDFDPARLGQFPAAHLNVELAAKGKLSPLAAELDLRLFDSRLRGQPLGGKAQLTVTPGRIAAADIALDAAGNRLRLQGAYGAPADRLQIAIEAPQLGALPGLQAGSLDARGWLGGSPERPYGELQAAAKGIELAGGWRLAAASMDLRLPPDAGPFTLAADLGKVARAEQGLLDAAQLRIDGSRAMHRISLHASLPHGDSLQAALRGALRDGPLWDGQIESLALAGSTPFAAALAEPVALQVAAKRLELGPARISGARASLRLLETRWDGVKLTSRGEIGGLGFTPPPMQGDLRLGGRWNVQVAAAVDGQLLLQRESGDLRMAGEGGLALGLTELRLQAGARANQLQAALVARGERFGRLDAQAAARAEQGPQGWRLAPSAPVSGSATLEIARIDWLAPLLDVNMRSAGRLSGRVDLAGTAAAPRFDGRIEGEALEWALLNTGVRLSDGSLKARFSADRLWLDEFRFTSPLQVKPRESRLPLDEFAARPGSLSASGSLSFPDFRADLKVRAERFLALQRPDRWVALSGSAALQGERAAGYVVSGNFKADAGYAEIPEAGAPSLSDDVVIKGRAATQAAPVRLTYAVEADFGRAFYLKGRGLDTRLTGALKLRAEPGGRLRASGSIATRGGNFDAYGQALRIERGIVNFQGTLDDPGLNVRALRDGIPVEAGVEVGGTARRPRVRLVSEPAMPDSEKLSWIILGHGQEQKGDTGLLIAAAGALLGGQSGGVSRQLADALGVDQITLTQGDLSASGLGRGGSRVVGGGDTNAPLASQIFTVGKRLSDKVYLSYEQSLAGAQNIVKLSYHLSRRLEVIGRAGTDNALDLRYSFSFK